MAADGARAAAGGTGDWTAPRRIARIIAPSFAGLRHGLQEGGVVEGKEAAIEARWARGQFDRLPGLAADLVRMRASVIVTQTLPAALAAKAATATIPIVFVIGEDPVEVGLVHTLNRPGSNVTGLSNFMNLLGAKRIELLVETLPTAKALALLVNPNNPNAEPDTRTLQVAAQALGRHIAVLKAASQPELQSAFAAIAERRIEGIFVNIDSFFASHTNQWLRWRRTTAFRHLIHYAASSRLVA